MMVSSNIPLHKVDIPSFRNFLEKYTTHPIPTESTLRKNYLTSCYNDTINKIRNYVGNNKIWVSIDETTDVSGRFVVYRPAMLRQWPDCRLLYYGGATYTIPDDIW